MMDKLFPPASFKTAKLRKSVLDAKQLNSMMMMMMMRAGVGAAVGVAVRLPAPLPQMSSNVLTTIQLWQPVLLVVSMRRSTRARSWLLYRHADGFWSIVLSHV
jgi:hypothetical protein